MPRCPRLIDRRTPEALAEAIERADHLDVDPADIRAHAQTFDRQVFRAKMREILVRNGADPELIAPT